MKKNFDVTFGLKHEGSRDMASCAEAEDWGI